MTRRQLGYTLLGVALIILAGVLTAYVANPWQ